MERRWWLEGVDAPDNADFGSKYNANDARDAGARFSSNAAGFKAWLDLLESVGVGANATPADDPDALAQAFDVFMASVAVIRAAASGTPATKTVFISHQRNDVDFAERIAYQATQESFDYWLDIHDPVIKAVPASHPSYPILIAAIVEIALLNCTHVIAVQTCDGRKSKWIPYEFGRAKAHSIISLDAGSWIHPSMTVDDFGEYIRLCLLAPHGGDTTARDWLKAWKGNSPGKVWGFSYIPNPLP